MKDFRTYQGATKDSVEDFVKRNEGRKESDLMHDLYEKAKEGKRNGTLTDKQIDEFVKRVSPMLGGEQKRKLDDLVEKLKRL